MKLQNIDTPALFVDAKVLKQNIAAMDELLKESNLKLRPHFKSHKCSVLAHLQMKHGAKGMTCAKLSEAIDPRGGAALPAISRARRPGSEKYTDRTESPPGCAHHEEVLCARSGSGGFDLHWHDRSDQGNHYL